MANADTVSGVLNSAGFEEITLRRCDLPIMIGLDIDEAVGFVMSLGPAGEILRLAGDRAISTSRRRRTPRWARRLGRARWRHRPFSDLDRHRRNPRRPRGPATRCSLAA